MHLENSSASANDNFSGPKLLGGVLFLFQPAPGTDYAAFVIVKCWSYCLPFITDAYLPRIYSPKWMSIGNSAIAICGIFLLPRQKYNLQ